MSNQYFGIQKIATQMGLQIAYTDSGLTLHLKEQVKWQTAKLPRLFGNHSSIWWSQLSTTSGSATSRSQMFTGGEYSSPGRDDWVIFHVKVEIITTLAKSPEIQNAILQFARTGKSGDGLFYIEEIDDAVRIRDGREVPDDEENQT